MKLYKYRPLSDLLYKELYYGELYFASYPELNDPLDLSARINFKPSDSEDLQYLFRFLARILFMSRMDNDGINKGAIKKYVNFTKNHDSIMEDCHQLYNEMIVNDAFNHDFISFDNIWPYVQKFFNKFEFEIEMDVLSNEFLRLSKVFFEKSTVACFSESHTDFLMWSHYASKHHGVCLEFTLEREGEFPYIFSGRRKEDKNKFLEKYSEWNIEESQYWDKINKIEYVKSAPSISFYEFLPVFANEGDCDLMGLSKSKWHGFAHELKRVYSTKTLPWEYEKEWRAIRIHFDKIVPPEKRISHYPVEALTAIYFGIRTQDTVKERIYHILNDKNENIQYFEGQLTNDRNITFNKWVYFED